MDRYVSLGNTLGAVLLSALGYEVLAHGGDWKAAVGALGVTTLTALIKTLNPADRDLGVGRQRE